MTGKRIDMRSRLHTIASEQAGYFTASQAREVGYSYAAQAHHVRAGNWERVDRALFRLASPRLDTDPNADLARWQLWSGGKGVVSGRTALVVHGVGELEPTKVELTVPKGFRKRNDAVSLRFDELSSEDIEPGPGFQVTTVTRSIIDVAESTDQDQLTRLTDEALNRGLTSKKRLRSRSEELNPTAALRIERALAQLEAQP